MAEYWTFQLISNTMLLVPVYVFRNLGGYEPGEPTLLSLSAIIIPGAVMLTHIIPGLAVTVRRLHDVGVTGWFLLILILPVIGPLILIVMMCLPSAVGNNGYGANPYDIQV